MAYSNHQLGTINMLYFPKKICYITPLPPHNGHLCTTATFFVLSPGRPTHFLREKPWGRGCTGKVTVVERFDCKC